MKDPASMEGRVVWHPTNELIENANITKFSKKHSIPDFETLLERAANEPDWFYPAILNELDIPWIKEYEAVYDFSDGIEFTRWFKGGLTNLYLYALEKHVKKGHGDRLALIWEGEDGATRTVTFKKLKEETDRLASALKKLGLKKGDGVGVFLPQVPEIQPILFACAKLGAIIIPCFSGFGADSIATRLNAAQAKWLFACDWFFRRGKRIDMKKVAEQVVALVPTLEKVIYVNRKPGINNSQVSNDQKHVLHYEDLIELGKKLKPVKTEPMASDETMMIIYTSGTTGKPKGTNHTHYSFPLKNAIDMYFCFDVKPGDRMFWLTDIGWMMGPWLIFGTAILGATAVIYEGSPDYPDEQRLFELIEKHKITIFGVAPSVVRSLMRKLDAPETKFDLSSLRILGSTGEPWSPPAWLWYLEKFGENRCPIINYSGGTEVSGGILSCVPVKPLKPCSFHGPAPGMAAAVVNKDGEPVIENEVGDLVITKPFLGMTYSFYQDRERYLASYWRTWEGLWHHGDYAQIDEDGFWYILGRSDDTMNIAGKRLGPADLESAVAAHPNVKESAAVGIPDEVKGEVPVIFVVLHEKTDDERKTMRELMELISQKLGKAFLPKDIFFVDSLPRTQSGKIARRLVRAAYLGEKLGDTSTLQNPESIQQIQKQ